MCSLNSFAELTTPAAPIPERIQFIDGASTPPLPGGEYSAHFSALPIHSHLVYERLFFCESTRYGRPTVHSPFRMGFSTAC